MTTYTKKSLGDGEEIILQSKIAWPYHVRAWLSLIFLGVFIVGIIIFVRSMIWINTTEFALTNRRVLFKEGWVRRQTSELALTTVEEVEVRQGFWGRLFGFGSIQLSGSGAGEVFSPPIADPLAFRAALSDACAHAVAGENIN